MTITPPATANDAPYQLLYFGAPYSFSHQAAEKVLPRILNLLSLETGQKLEEKEIPLISVEDQGTITGALDASHNTFAIVPLSSSKLGDVYDFLPFYYYQLVDREPLEVQFWLCSKDGQIDKIRMVRTKNTAYEQVKEDLWEILPRVKVEANEEATSMAAAKAFSDETLAAICSPEACEKYHLQRLADLGKYTTTFGVFRNEPRITHARPDIQAKMSILLRGGALYTGSIPGGRQQEFASLLSERRKPLCIKWGIDPIRDSLHLGHFANLLKLGDFKAFDHHIVVVLGTFTGKIGDPSGNLEQRERLDHIHLSQNAEKIKRQIIAILGNDVEFVENHTLVEPLNIEKLLKWGYKIDIRRMHDRQDFDQRRKSKRAIYLSEFLYALFQAHDSIQLHVDVEIGGIDQIYNCSLARYIMELEGITPEFTLLLRLLRGTDGSAKMSSFTKNDIRLSESKKEIRKKLMAIDEPESVLEYLRLITRIPEETIGHWADGLHNKKIKLADVQMEMVNAVLGLIPDNM